MELILGVAIIFVGNFNYTFYEKVQLNKLQVCLVCGSYQCPFCPHFAAGSTLLPSTILLSASIIFAVIFNSLDLLKEFAPPLNHRQQRLFKMV